MLAGWATASAIFTFESIDKSLHSKNDTIENSGESSENP